MKNIIIVWHGGIIGAGRTLAKAIEYTKRCTCNYFYAECSEQCNITTCTDEFYKRLVGRLDRITTRYTAPGDPRSVYMIRKIDEKYITLKNTFVARHY